MILIGDSIPVAGQLQCGGLPYAGTLDSESMQKDIWLKGHYSDFRLKRRQRYVEIEDSFQQKVQLLMQESFPRER